MTDAGVYRLRLHKMKLKWIRNLDANKAEKSEHKKKILRVRLKEMIAY